MTKTLTPATNGSGLRIRRPDVFKHPAFLAGLTDAKSGFFIPRPWELKKGGMTYERGWHFGRGLQRMGKQLPKSLTDVNGRAKTFYLSIYNELRERGDIL